MTTQFSLSHKDFIRRFQDKSLEVEVDDDALEEYNKGKKKEAWTMGLICIVIGVPCIGWIWWVGLGLMAVGIFGIRSHENEKESEVIAKSLRASVYYNKYIEKGILKIEESASDDDQDADDEEEEEDDEAFLEEEAAKLKPAEARKARVEKAASRKRNPSSEEEEENT